MASSNFTAAIAALNALTSDELNDLVPYWKQIAKTKRSITGAKIVESSKVQIGQIVCWDSEKRNDYGRHYLTVSNFNRAMTCAVGFECDANGKQLFPQKKWTVALTFLKAIK